MTGNGEYFVGGLDDLTDEERPQVDPLLQYWTLLANSHGSPPPVTSFDILEIAHLAHWHVVVDVVSDGQDYVFRLIGTNLHPLMGVDLTGRNLGDLEEAHPEIHERGFRLYSNVIQAAAPIVTRRVSNSFEHDSPATVVTCAVPFSGDGGVISQIAQITRVRAKDGRWLD